MLDQKRNNVVVSRRSVLEQENSAEREALLESLQEGMEGLQGCWEGDRQRHDGLIEIRLLPHPLLPSILALAAVLGGRRPGPQLIHDGPKREEVERVVL